MTVPQTRPILPRRKSGKVTVQEPKLSMMSTGSWVRTVAAGWVRSRLICRAEKARSRWLSKMRCISFAPGGAEKAQEVAVGDFFDVGAIIATAGEDVEKFLQVGDGVVVDRSPFAAEPAV